MSDTITMGTATSLQVYNTTTASDSYERSSWPVGATAITTRIWGTPQLHTRIYPVDLTAHPVFSMSRSELINTWVARFGENWVHARDYQYDEFWGKVAMRMHAMHLLETHNLMGPDGGNVCRIILEK